MVAVQGHPPPELEVGYADEQDALVEDLDDGYDQDQLDQQEFEAEGYPNVFEGRPATSAELLRLALMAAFSVLRELSHACGLFQLESTQGSPRVGLCQPLRISAERASDLPNR